MEQSRPDLSMFDDVNKGRVRKRTWESRRKLIAQRFPSIDTIDWVKEFDKDLDLFADIMRDILKVDAASPGRSGPKPAVEYRQGVSRFRQLVDDDYSMLPFRESFESLKGTLSLTTLARKVDLSRARVYRLLTGEGEPSLEEMEKIAKGFKKRPSYFHDYRVTAMLEALRKRLEDNPETSVGWYQRVVEAA